MTHTGLDTQTAGEKAYTNIPPKIQKELEICSVSNGYKNKRKIQCIRNNANKGCACEFLIKRRLKDYSFTDDSDDELYFLLAQEQSFL